MRSLRTDLIICFLALISLPLALTYWSFSVTFQKNTQDFVRQTTVNILTQTDAQIASLIESAEQIVEYQNDLFKKRAVSFSREQDDTRSEHSIRELLKANVVNLEGVRNIGVVNLQDKHFYMSYRDENQRLVTKETITDSQKRRQSRFWREAKHDNGNLEDVAGTWAAESFNVEERPWYKAALDQSGIPDFDRVWTKPYAFKESGEVGITCSKAINSPGEGYREPFAIAFADISLNGISEVLRALDLGHNSRLVLVNKQGLVLASSLPEQSEWLKAHGELPHITQIAKGLINKANWQALQNKGQQSAPAVSQHITMPLQTYRYNNVEYFARSLNLQHELLTPFNWDLWVFVPQESLLDEYRKTVRKVYLYAAVAAIAGLLISLFIWAKISKELSRVVIAFNRVGEGDLKARVDLNRPYIEIEKLISSFYQMLSALWENTFMQRLISKSAKKDIASKSHNLDEERLIGQSVRKECTFLFSDVRGFTSFSESREPEEVITILNEYLSLHADIIEQHEGDIDKYVGDEVIALFEGEQAEFRAVQAAWQIYEKIVAKNQHKATKLNVGIGIHTGQVVAGYVGSEGRAEHTAIGSTVNFAARLCSKAAPGQILISREVLDKINLQIETQAIADMTFKGFSQPITVFQVTKIKND